MRWHRPVAGIEMDTLIRLAELLIKRHAMATGLGLTHVVQIGQMNVASNVRIAGPGGRPSTRSFTNTQRSSPR